MFTSSGSTLDRSVFISSWSGIVALCATLSFGPNDSLASCADIRVVTKTVEQHRRIATKRDIFGRRRARTFKRRLMQKNRAEESLPAGSHIFL